MADRLSSIHGVDFKSADAFKGAFDAMQKWRDEISQTAERRGAEVFDKLGVAAKAAGWPDALIDTTKSQLMQASKMQTDMIDHMMDAWQTQVKSPGSPGQLMGSLIQAPGKPLDMTNLALLPTQLMMQSLEIWRKNWTDAMAIWTGGLMKPGQDGQGKKS